MFRVNEELPADAKQYVEVQKEKKFTISEINLASSKQQQAQQQQALATDTQRLHEQATARFDFGELKFGAQDYASPKFIDHRIWDTIPVRNKPDSKEEIETKGRKRYNAAGL